MEEEISQDTEHNSSERVELSEDVFDDTLLRSNFQQVKHQFRFLWTDPARYKVIVACRGGGKTVAVMQYLMSQILARPNADVTFCGQNFVTVGNTIDRVLNYYNQAWEERGLCTISKNDTKHFWKYDFGDGQKKTFTVASYEKGEGNRGPHTDILVLDESGLLPTQLFENALYGMIEDVGKHKGKAIYIGTPKGTGNLFYENYVKGGGVSGKEGVEGYKSYTFKASDSGLLSEERVQEAKRVLSPSAFMQEYECSFEVAAGDSWVYSKQLYEMSERIRDDVTYDSATPCYVAMDLGFNDYTAAWYFQPNGSEVRLIDYYQAKGKQAIEHMNAITSRGYKIKNLFLPHDGRARNATAESTWEEIATKFDLRPIVLSPGRVMPGIVGVCNMLLSARINASACAEGIHGLHNYQVKVESRTGQITESPLHVSPYCDCADALRYVYESREYWRSKTSCEEIRSCIGSYY
jgi:hypothetical protein